MRLRGTDAFVRTHCRRDAEMPSEIRDQRFGETIVGRDRVVVQPCVQLRRPYLVGAVHIDDVDQSQLPSRHRHGRLVRSVGTGDIRSRQLMADDVRGGNVGEHGRGDAPLSVLLGRDDRRRRRPSLVDDVEFQLHRARPHHDRPREHRRDRADRFLRKAFGHSDNRLCYHLRALDHLAIVLARGPRLGDESILSVGLHVEEVEQALKGPRRLRGVSGHGKEQ
jgi:hypothetical protein